MSRIALKVGSALASCLGAVMGAAGSASAQSADCQSMQALKLDHGQVLEAVDVAPGSFLPRMQVSKMPPPAGGKPGDVDPIYGKIPRFCRVTAELRPSRDSIVKVEVWLPASGWNGRFQAVGNGAFSSAIQYNAMAQALGKGYAVAGTNTGHEGTDGSFSIGYPERVKDWGSRAVHETAVTGKALVKAFFGKAAAFSYWNSCSTGGRQGWVAAQYYPEDFNGIVAGDPANPMTLQQANSLWSFLQANRGPAYTLSRTTMDFLNKAVLEACDANDGLKDRLIENPMNCKFDPATLLCRPDQVDGCLTSEQLDTVESVLRGLVSPTTGKQWYPGFPIADVAIRADGGAPDIAAISTFKMLFQDTDWDYRRFDIDRDVPRLAALGRDTIDAVDQQKMTAFFKGGGKFLMYHGWKDNAITPLVSIKLHDDVVRAAGGAQQASKFLRLFMAPGMGHCAGGEGPNVFDPMEPITAWVEQGKAPDRIVAAHMTGAVVDRTRPLCAYPRVARYLGRGSINEAANFACADPSPAASANQ